MENFGYEIKFGKYLSFRHKDKKDGGRFTRAKASTLGEDYTKDRIKERINTTTKQKIHPQNNSNRNFDNIVDTKNNQKVKSSKGYQLWAEKHNMRTMASTLNELRKYELNSYDEVEQKLQSIALERQHLLNTIRQKEKEMALIYTSIENLNTLSENAQIYNVYKKNPKDKLFKEEYKAQIITYESAKKQIQNSPY